MIQDGKLNTDGVQKFLNTYYFGKRNPSNRKGLAVQVIETIDRNLKPLDYYHCNLIRTDLKKDGIDLDTVSLHECMAVLQDPDAPQTDTSVALNRLIKNPLKISDFVKSLTENKTLQFFWYSGAKDPFSPSDDYNEELTALKDLTATTVHYHPFKASGTDGYTSEPQVWVDLKSQVSGDVTSAPQVEAEE